jgi:MSHA biogenesis protein MshQ
VNTHSVSSSGYTEGSAALRSGQLKLSNAFGSEKASLSVPVQAQYWSSKAWVLNSADSCTSVPLAAVSRSNYLDYKGASTAAWTTTASAVTIVGGHGTLTLTAPSPAATGSLDVAFNLGATTTDNSCLSTHATTTGANLSWLRSRNGNCAATYDRDPSARSTFGIFSPESEKTFHVRDIL